MMQLPQHVSNIMDMAVSEWWETPDVPHIERYPSRRRRLEVPDSILRKIMAKPRASFDSEDECTAEIIPPERKLCLDELKTTPVYWILAAVETVRLGIHELQDPYGVKLHGFLDERTREIVKAFEIVSDAAIAEAGRNAIPKRRPKDQEILRRVLMSPYSDGMGPTKRWATVAACVANKIGMVLACKGFPDCLCWNDTIVWVSDSGVSLETVDIKSAGERLVSLARDLVVTKNPSMTALRDASAFFRVQRPLKRSRVGLVDDLRLKIYRESTLDNIVIPESKWRTGFKSLSSV